MNKERARVTAEIWALRVRNILYTIVQLTGFAVIFYGIHQMLKPILYLNGHDISLPEWIGPALPNLGMGEGLIVMSLGLAIVWISTARWF